MLAGDHSGSSVPSLENGPLPPKNLPPGILKEGPVENEMPRSISMAIPMEGDLGPTLLGRGDGKAVSGRTQAGRVGTGVWDKLREGTKNQPLESQSREIVTIQKRIYT